MSPKARGKSSGKFSVTYNASIPKEPPAPFARAPAQLMKFLENLPEQHIYITTLDKHPPDFKRKIFLVPLILNVSILVLLAYRIYNIVPFYTYILLDRAGYPNHTTLTPAAMSWLEITLAVLWRAGNLAFDFGLYMFVSPWPHAFFVGSDFGTPLEWRWSLGFRDTEIVVRRSKRWDQDLGDVVVDQTTPKSRLFSANVRFAVSKAFMKGKTAYSMLNKEWDLDFLAMVDAATLVDEKELSIQEFETRVLVHTETFGWLVYETQDDATNEEEAQRRKIIAFKDELTALGKENLFFKWIELIQYESSQAGGFGPERQANTIEKAKAMFEAQDVDFERFWKKVGGMDGLPGMEQFQ